jgi:hypothetical protein
MIRILGPLSLLILIGCAQNSAPQAGKPDNNQLAKAAATKPRPEKEGLTWNHKELLDYLKAKGVAFTQSDRGPNIIGDAEKRIIVITLFPTSQLAHDNAGLLGDQAFSWGRFLFVASHGDDPSFLALPLISAR